MTAVVVEDDGDSEEDDDDDLAVEERSFAAFVCVHDAGGSPMSMFSDLEAAARRGAIRCDDRCAGEHLLAHRDHDGHVVVTTVLDEGLVIGEFLPTSLLTGRDVVATIRPGQPIPDKVSPRPPRRRRAPTPAPPPELPAAAMPGGPAPGPGVAATPAPLCKPGHVIGDTTSCRYCAGLI